jgi:IS5 family transposase
MRALLLQVFYSVCSERMLMEQMRYNMLFRWFVGLAMDDVVWDHSTFSKNRDRLLYHEVVEAFFTEVMTLADKQGLLSKEHFSVDGTLIQAWASHTSFMPKNSSDDGKPQGGGRNGQADWKGKPRSNATHASTTDADARLYKKSDNTPAVLGYLGHILIENRSGLVVGAVACHADGMAEGHRRCVCWSVPRDGIRKRWVQTRRTTHAISSPIAVRATLRRMWRGHVKRWGGGAIDGRTTRHGGYEISQVIRKRVEEHFGWGKMVGRIRQTVYRGLRRVDQQFKWTMVASNLTRMAQILSAVPSGVRQ